MPWKAFLRATRPTFLCASPKTKSTRQIITLTDSSTLEEPKRSQTLCSTTATPTVWDDSWALSPRSATATKRRGGGVPSTRVTYIPRMCFEALWVDDGEKSANAETNASMARCRRDLPLQSHPFRLGVSTWVFGDIPRGDCFLACYMVYILELCGAGSTEDTHRRLEGPKISRFRRCRLSELFGVHTRRKDCSMRDALFPFWAFPG